MSLVTIELFFSMLVFCSHVTWRSPRCIHLMFALASAFLLDLLYFPLIGTLDAGAVTLLLIAAKSLYYLVCFTSMAMVLRLCARVMWLESLVIAVAGYGVQHLSYNISELVMRVVDYGIPWRVNFTILHLVTFVVTCVVVYTLLGRQLIIDEDKIRARLGWVAACLASLVLMVVFSMVFVQRRPTEVQIVGLLYDSLCVMLMLAVLFLALSNNRLYSDLVMIQQSDRLKEQHYEMTKETIEQINIKCHDIRKLVGSLYADDGKMPTPEMIREVEQNIRIYDSLFHTGNDSLDILLTEKALYCSRHNITFTCMADGLAVNFMEQYDLYSLFGNIMDNAVESVRQISDISKRVINLSVKQGGDLLIIREENYYAPEHAPVFRNGMPVTTKPDVLNHGLGTRSIAWQTHKYHGELTMKASGEVFSLAIVMPVPR